MSNEYIPDSELLPERELITEAEAKHGFEESSGRQRAIIRTSDRILFKTCRRRWAWQSHLRGNLGPKRKASPLWLGSGIHYALEDFHSVRTYGSPAEAFKAYCKASFKLARKHNQTNSFPEDIHELIDLGTRMMEYYSIWLESREQIQTYIHNGVPQVEVNFKIKLPWEEGKYGLDDVFYSGQMDRVAIDEQGFLWIVEYKTAKAIQTSHYATDAQVTSYCWAASCIYDRPVAGVIYQQHRKTLPEEPRILANGTISTAQNMITSHRMYRQALIKVYGDVGRAPKANVDYLDALAYKEQPRDDGFIRRDYIYRNQFQIESEGQKIMMEADEMLNPELHLYPNPSRSCAFMCSFLSPCNSLDDGSDFEHELKLTTTNRETEYDSWRKYLEQPQEQSQQIQMRELLNLLQ